MKRNIISFIKLLVAVLLTILITIVIYHYIKGSLISDTNYLYTVNYWLQYSTPENYQSNKELDERIDWHNYEAIEHDKNKAGIGEKGEPATLSNTIAKQNIEKLYKVNGFNAALSDEISLNRSVPDIRHPECKKKKYLKRLNSVSVIISFHNEHLSTLLRTCWSVINRSPPELLEEIILVDDASTKVELNNSLDTYIEKYFKKVFIIRLSNRSGLIRGRLAGAQKAKAKVLVFLDSHTEANVNWLPPLAEPITKDYKTCVCPFIDVIAYDTFEYRAQDEGARGAFDWELYYKRLPLLPDDLKIPSEPFKSPVMAGGLFAISAKFFWELGGYDSGLDIWGGEQYELSFKIWQCGGQMLDVPCSRVAHIYRKFAPFPNPGRGDFLGKNYKRVAEVWMDEYAEYVYRRRPHLRALDAGDITIQKSLRKKLQCKPFKWFMENIAFDLIETYPPIEPDDFAYGEIRNIGAPELCLDTKRRTKNQLVIVDLCIKDNKKIHGEQEFRLTWRKDIRSKSRADCLDVSSGDLKAVITIYPCHGQKGNQLWRYDIGTQWLIHGHMDRCLDTDPATKKVYVTSCDSTSSTQKWRIEQVNMKAINDWSKNV